MLKIVKPTLNVIKTKLGEVKGDVVFSTKDPTEAYNKAHQLQSELMDEDEKCFVDITDQSGQNVWQQVSRLACPTGAENEYATQIKGCH